jgi:far upstream element-binding protein
MPPQAGAPGAPTGGDDAADPYAPYGGYQNYMIMWQLALAQQQGQQPGAQQGPPGT